MKSKEIDDNLLIQLEKKTFFRSLILCMTTNYKSTYSIHIFFRRHR